ncbi:isoflavone 7-O-methyltransferase [Cajanus cajan]|uniref:isoflavone 7-O-methyltransferase n=1 Tax=Cajanus cajan TaxID=3821 RepID=A0A151TCK0_CAJCA|nr:isoflavone 7-O-methyltransferase [Cajanus cajan]KYP64755.1 Isoflavone-7-O-methyltransferase 9 [Cajanus cajan]
MASNTGSKTSEIFQGQVLLYRNLYGLVDAMCLKWMAELGIPDIIHNHGQPITFPELVSTLQVPPTKVSGVQSLMHYLAHKGFFEIVRIHDNVEEKEAYALTAASELLVKGSDLCLAPMVECLLNPTFADSFHQLKKWTYEDDLTLFNISLGSPLWDFLNKNPAFNKLFNEAMASDSQMMNLALRDCKAFEGLESIVDVGGGTGITAKIICETFPNLKCIVLDRPHVVENLSGRNNLTYVGGDMFKSIPKADAVLFKWIFHNWNDNDCMKILENSKEAISSAGKKGKVIVIDIVINENKEEHEITGLKLMMDVHMASVINGKERREEEWKKLFVKAGFQSYKISPLTGYLSLIEIYP